MYEDLIPNKKLQCHVCQYVATSHNCLQNHVVTHSLALLTRVVAPDHRRCTHDSRSSGLGCFLCDPWKEGPGCTIEGWTGKRNGRCKVAWQRGQPCGADEKTRCKNVDAAVYSLAAFPLLVTCCCRTATLGNVNSRVLHSMVYERKISFVPQGFLERQPKDSSRK